MFLRSLSTEQTVLFSTHIVDDVKDLCTDLAILNKGKLLAHLSPQKALQQLEGKIWIRPIPTDQLEKWQARCAVLSTFYDSRNQLHIRIFSEVQPGGDFQSSNPSLEDFYFLTLAQ